MTSLLVFSSRYLRQHPWSIYLSSLSVSDTGFLLCLFFSWSNHIGIDVYHRQGWCQMLVYLTYIWSFLSVWYIVCFTVERYIVVKCPLKRLQLCTAKRTKTIVIILAVFAIVFYSFSIWTSGLVPLHGREEFCTSLDMYAKLVTILSYIDTSITLVLPTTIIILLNTLIIYSVTQHHNNRDTLIGEETKQVARKSRVYVTVSTTNNRRTQQQNLAHINRMLIIVSTTFVLLNLPFHFIRFYILFMELCNHSYRPPHWLVSCHKLFQYVYYLNFSINFVLYSICGSHFRHCMIQLLKRMCSYYNSRSQIDRLSNREEIQLFSVVNTRV